MLKVLSVLIISPAYDIEQHKNKAANIFILTPVKVNLKYTPLISS